VNCRTPSAIRFSLVLATVGRTDTLHRFLASLTTQTFRNYELILVDQNPDDRLGALLEQWRASVRCVRIRCAPGVSQARNAGIEQARGQIICFPDDDCWYPEDLLQRVSEWFESHIECPLLCICARSENGEEVSSRWPKQSCIVDRGSVLRTCSAICLFIQRAALSQAGGFDEAMGLGSHTQFQAAEDLDLALRVIECTQSGWFENSIWACHPRRDAATASPERGFLYGSGFGHLLRKHRYGWLVWAYHVLRAAAGAARSVLYFRFREAAFYWNSVQGRIAGYCVPVTESRRQI
jgi:glycosyltransferase involved in cell wall biosynthesis